MSLVDKKNVKGHDHDHPIAASAGAAAAATAGMVAGAVIAGPVGAAVGGAIGAAAGSLAGEAIGHAVNPDAEDAYWRENYRSRPYVASGKPYDEYRDAYRYGWESRASRPGTWDEAESDLSNGWDRARSTSSLAWTDAKEAVRDGWHRVERALPGDANRDGR